MRRRAACASCSWARSIASTDLRDTSPQGRYEGDYGFIVEYPGGEGMRLRLHPADARHGRAAAYSRIALAVLCALLVSACGEMRRIEQERDAAAVGLSNAEVRHPIGFTPKQREPRRGGAGRRRRAEPQPAGRRLSASSTATSARPPDACVITVPTGVRDQAAIAQSLQEIQRQVAEAGIDYRLRHGARHDARSGGTPAIRLAYQRPVAVPPPCDDWTRGRRPQRGAHSLSELGLRHAAQPRPDGRQRARPRPAAGGRPPIERAAQRQLVGLRG